MSQNTDSWEMIFKNGNFLEKIERDGFVTVTPTELKRLGNQREPRLLAKQDQKKSRPKIFIEHGLSLLAVRNDKYLIFKDEGLKTYYSLENVYDSIPTEEYVPERDYGEYQSLSPLNISSESQAIDYAYLVSLIKKFTGEEELFLTIRGRQRSRDFSFEVRPNCTAQVSGVQIEVDAGFESPGKIYIIEGKIGRVNDFNIRQLFYPYRDWMLKSTKDVIPIFFVYTNGLFYFLEFKFSDNYGDLSLIKAKCYTVNEPKKLTINVRAMLKTTVVENEPDVPYPQADDLDKVIDIVINNYAGLRNKRAIADFFNFDERQGDYYANAAIYLGLLKRDSSNNSEFILTPEGKNIANFENRNTRNLVLVQQILKRPTLREIIDTTLKNGGRLNSVDRNLVIDVVQKYIKTPSTANRRSSTVIQWIRWIDENVEMQ